MAAERFAQAAARLAGMAAWLLGWRPGDFWAATPDELAGIWAVARGEQADGVPPDAAEIARLKEMFPDG